MSTPHGAQRTLKAHGSRSARIRTSPRHWARTIRTRVAAACSICSLVESAGPWDLTRAQEKSRLSTRTHPQPPRHRRHRSAPPLVNEAAATVAHSVAPHHAMNHDHLLRLRMRQSLAPLYSARPRKTRHIPRSKTQRHAIEWPRAAAPGTAHITFIAGTDTPKKRRWPVPPRRPRLQPYTRASPCRHTRLVPTSARARGGQLLGRRRLTRALPGSRVDLFGLPVPSRGSAPLTIGPPSRRPRPRRGFHVPRTRDTTGVGAPILRGQRCSHDRLIVTGRRLPPRPAAGPCILLFIPPPRAWADEASSGFTCVRTSGLPLARMPPGRNGPDPVRGAQRATTIVMPE